MMTSQWTTVTPITTNWRRLLAIVSNILEVPQNFRPSNSLTGKYHIEFLPECDIRRCMSFATGTMLPGSPKVDAACPTHAFCKYNSLLTGFISFSWTSAQNKSRKTSHFEELPSNVPTFDARSVYTRITRSSSNDDDDHWNSTGSFIFSVPLTHFG